MGAPVFNSEVLDSWLNTKTNEILGKVDREKITTEEMLILVLKAQTNHFHHVDKEFRDEFGGMRKRFDEVDKRFEQVDKRFEQVDKRFERLEDDMKSGFKWIGGIIITLFAGIYLKLFLG